MAVKTEELKARMLMCGITAKDLANALGINESTYYRRMANHGATFTVEQAQKIAEILRMSRDDAVDIFLS